MKKKWLLDDQWSHSEILLKNVTLLSALFAVYSALICPLVSVCTPPPENKKIK